MLQKDYFEIARKNELVFRGILRDIRDTGKMFVPNDLDTESDLDCIFEKYSKGQRYGKFTILDFSRPEIELARLSFQDVATLSGGGAELEYVINQDESVEYAKAVSV